MSTNCCTVVKNEQDEVLLVMRRHWDGYPEGHGIELAEFLASKNVVDGLTLDQDKSKIANGIECLAAQIVAHFKKEPGGFYLSSFESLDSEWDYSYTVTIRGKTIYLCVRDEYSEETIYDGSVNEFKARVESC